MALTLVFMIACLAFGANGKGLYKQLAKPVCDGQQTACTYCEKTIEFAHGLIDDPGFESALVGFGVVICDFMDAASPEYKECVDYINKFPVKARMIADLALADSKELCSFVCTSKGSVSNNCQVKPPANFDCAVKKNGTQNVQACEVCKSVPELMKQILSGQGVLDLLEKFLLLDCDLIAPGCENDMCVDHTKFLSTKIKFFVTEFMNPVTSCEFVCGK